MAEKRIGLALSGGAALGGAHLGVLEVLEAYGVRPDVVSGTSAGSAVGVLFCAGFPLAGMRELALELEWSQIGQIVRPRRGFFDGRRLEEYLIRLIGDVRFGELKTPLAVAAADILREELVILREGRVAPAVRASCALPGVFTPVEYQGHLLVDGGLINNLPVAVLKDMGADYVIAVDLAGPLIGSRKRPTGMLDMWLLTLATLLRNVNREAALADTVIQPKVGEFNPADLSKMPILIERGREAAEAVIRDILRDLSPTKETSLE